jgi:glucose/arabinose dehydrogenase
MLSVQYLIAQGTLVKFGSIAFALTFILIIGAEYSPPSSFAVSNSTTKNLVYGCEIFEKGTHCDALVKDLPSYRFSAESNKSVDVTGSPNIVQGRIGSALQMDASRIETVEIPDSPVLNNSNFSVSFWVKLNPPSQPNGYIVSHVGNPTPAGWYFDMTSQGEGSSPYVRFNVVNNISQIFRSQDLPISSSDFTNIAATFNGTTLSSYVDGKLQGTTSFNGSYDALPHTPLTIGSPSWCSGCFSWSGIIDDLRIYNRTLSDEEVGALNAGSDNGNLSLGLVAYYNFDADLKDRASAMNDGKIITIIGGMGFAPDGRLFFTEKNTGQIRIMKDSQIMSIPFAKLDDYFVSWEQGLLGIAIDPNFAENHFIYLYYTAIDKNTGEIFNRVIRFTEQDNKAVEKTILIDRIFAQKGFHSGGALAFGPDDKLYITVGDATEHPFAQDLSVNIGKVLRINRDGTIPTDNPFPNSPIYTLGHRNMFGIAFDKKSGLGIVTENGDAHYDEINLIQKGGNYGFPSFQPANQPPGIINSSHSIAPLRSYWKIIAPTQAIYYDGNKFPELKGKFLFGTFSGDIYAIKIDNKTKQISSEEKLELGLYPFMPVVSLAQSPSGDIYFGGYSLDKLVSLNDDDKISTMESIYLQLPDSVKLDDLQLDTSQRKLDLSLSDSGGGNITGTTMVVKIPSSLLTDIYKVVQVNKTPSAQTLSTDVNTGNEIDFTVTDSTPDYSSIEIPLQIQGNALISIIAG